MRQLGRLVLSVCSLLAFACSGNTSITQVNGTANSGGSSNGGGSTASGGLSASGGKSATTSGSAAGGAVSGGAASAGATSGGTAGLGGTSTTATTAGSPTGGSGFVVTSIGGSSTGGSTGASGGTSSTVATLTGGSHAGGTSNTGTGGAATGGTSAAATGGSATGGTSAAATGGAATGGAATGGTSAAATGGAATGGAATGGTSAAATGGAATGGTSAAATTACDTNNDGLIDNSSCVTSPTYLRFVNTSASLTFDVYVTGASKPVVTGLVPWQVAFVGPVQAALIDYEFRSSGITPVPGELNALANNRYSIVVYLDPTLTPSVLKTASGAQLTTGACGTSSAQVAFGQFTTIAANPVVILYSTNGTSWTAPISPGLNSGQIFGSGCWSSTTLQFGAGPAAATTPTVKYQSTSFTATLTYQLLMTDDRIIRIDNLDRVTVLPKL